MEKIIKCSRCGEDYSMNYRSRMGLCRWCEETLIAAERELSRRCGLRPMTSNDIEGLNKYWQKRKSNKAHKCVLKIIGKR